MCGIAGFIGKIAGLEQQREWIERMTAALNHRGPDGTGVWMEGNVALGHRRLSIIDIEGGAQPMEDGEGQAVVVSNGEIYNFRELRERLEKKGFHFKTRSDTEVLLKLYLDSGTDLCKSLEGMFSFAIWDRANKRLVAARDPMGKKPFYYTCQNGVFAFASELTALAKLPAVELMIERGAIARFLANEYVASPESIYRNVYKLKPGHFLVVEAGKCVETPYWDLPPAEDRPSDNIEEYSARTVELLQRAVSKRLAGDVPAGIFLSGGIDSAAVAALTVKCQNAGNVQTFTMGFEESSYDESSQAQQMAVSLGLMSHVEFANGQGMGEILPGIMARIDEPLADPSVVPMYALSAFAARHVKFVLGGDGADELFGGYEYFPAFAGAGKYAGLPSVFRQRILEPLLRRLPVSDDYTSPWLVMNRFFEGTNSPDWMRVPLWLGGVLPSLQANLWADIPKETIQPESLYAAFNRRFMEADRQEPLDRIFRCFAREYLLNYILVKIDRCSMMHGLEVRAPFLDKNLVEFAFRIPASIKMRYGRRKYLLKKALGQILPSEIMRRKKRGFLIPVASWLRGVLKPLADEFLGAGYIRKQGLFRPDTIERLRKEHSEGRADRRKELWTLLVLQLWLNAHKPPVR